MNNNDANLIISFNKPSIRTNIDFREKLCLHKKEIFEFRQLTCCIDNEEELQLIVGICGALMLIVHHIKEDADEHCPTHAAVLPMLPTLPAMPTLPTISTMDSLGPHVKFPAMDAMKEKNWITTLSIWIHMVRKQ